MLKSLMLAALGLGLLGAARAAQAAHSRLEDEEAEKLLQSIQQSLRDALPGAVITSSLTAADLRNLDPPNIYSDPDWLAAREKAIEEDRRREHRRRLARAAEDDDEEDEGGEHRERSARAARAAEPDDDAEEVPASGAGAGSGESTPGCEEGDGQPPASGLRRWVIRMRNIMFGRRDLEGSEGGEAEGEPEPGRTWVESLAHWFAHGIKRILVRISGGEQPAEAEAGAEPEHGTDAPAPSTVPPPLPAPAPGRREPTTQPPAPASASSSPSPPEVKAPAKVPSKAAGASTAPNKIPTDVPTKAPTRTPSRASPSDTVYDDEAFSKPRPAFEETNELS